MSPLVFGCVQKKRYRSKDEAQQQLDRWAAMGHNISGRVAYACVGCGGSHIGHQRLKGGNRR